VISTRYSVEVDGFGRLSFESDDHGGMTMCHLVEGDIAAEWEFTSDEADELLRALALSRGCGELAG
jgi:hypothetical protein